MKKILILFWSWLAIVMVQVVYGNCCFNMDNWYTELAAGSSWHRDSALGDGANVKENVGFEINYSIGFKMPCDCFRLALEAHYERFSNDEYRSSFGENVNDIGHLSTTALLFNLFYDIPINNCFVWYFGAGAGAGIHRLKLRNDLVGCATKEDMRFAWQLMSGFVFDINPCWAVTLNYAWLSLLRPDAPTTSRASGRRLRHVPFSNNVDLGLRLKF